MRRTILSKTKIIIFLVGVFLISMVFAKVQEAKENPFQIGNRTFSCNGQTCVYTVEINNKSLQVRKGTLNVETYSIMEISESESHKKLEFRANLDFEINPNQAKIIQGEYPSEKQPNKWLFEAKTRKN